MEQGKKDYKDYTVNDGMTMMAIGYHSQSETPKAEKVFYTWGTGIIFLL